MDPHSGRASTLIELAGDCVASCWVEEPCIGSGPR